ncbi:MAG: FAD-dependent oxidoreductase [Thermoplasmatota archaeon]
MTEKYEAVVVGAGPAGLAAAMELSRNGVQTLILERGKKPGSKTVTGGILYGQTNTPYNLDYLLPGFDKTAPVERPIDTYFMHAMAGDKVAPLDLRGLHLHQHKWSYSVLRAPFDAWFASRVHEVARKTGGGLLTDIHVKGPLMEGNEVVGIETDELDPIKADLIIAADGATSELVRKAGLRDWMPTSSWFQGVKAVVKMDSAKMESAFGLQPGRGAAHLFAGDLFEGVRGGGFLYTNKDTLSIGTVFHLDSLAKTRVEPHKLLDRLLTHPLVSNWIGNDYQEIEYSAKLVPDGKKAILANPTHGRMLAVGDAAGQMLAHGPVIKGMNLGVSAGIMAARSYLDAKAAGDAKSAGSRYVSAMRASYVYKDTRPMRYRFLGKMGERAWVNRWMEGSFKHGFGRRYLKSKGGRKRVERMMSSPFWAGAMPDIRFAYVTLPTAYAEEYGAAVERTAKYDTPTLDERIAALTYDTAIGKPHIQLLDNRPEASGDAVWTCPVSSPSSTRGCYRFETVKSKDGERRLVALDTQPCVECGTCGVVAATKWEHPPGGKGVQYRQG